jgi:acetyl esterase/lipase
MNVQAQGFARRTYPIPTTISADAQAALARGHAFGDAVEPDASDIPAWEAHVERVNGMITEMLRLRFGEDDAFVVADHKLAHAALYEVAPRTATDTGHAVFYVHGGGFTTGGGIGAAYAAMSVAGLANLKTYAVDYRMPPFHRFPAGLDDTVEAYRWVLQRHDPAHIAVYGPSAGGGLAASFLLKARDLGLPMPAACVLHTPEADLTEAGDSFETNADADGVLKRLTQSIALYADGHDLRDPYLSPIFGDFTKGFPPTILTSGTRDLFLSNTVLMHRALLRAGIEAELHIWEAMGHTGFLGAAPEDREVMEQQVRFVRRHLGLNIA